MSEATVKKGLLRRLGEVLRGADTVLATPEAATAEVGALRLEVQERGERIAALEESCARLEQEARGAVESARSQAAVGLLEAVAGPLSQLATMRAVAAQGTAPEVGDVLRLAEMLQGSFEEAGLEPTGAVGEQVAFDPALHRPLGREQFEAGESVHIRFVGFRLGERVVRPALVSKEGN